MVSEYKLHDSVAMAGRGSTVLISITEGFITAFG